MTDGAKEGIRSVSSLLGKTNRQTRGGRGKKRGVGKNARVFSL